MSVRKNKELSFIKIGIEAAVNILVIFGLIVLVAILVSRGVVPAEYIRLASMTAIAIGCLAASFVMRADIVCSVIVTAVLVAVMLLGAAIMSKGEIQANAVLKSAACIVIGRFIPIVIKRGEGSKNKHKSRKRQKRHVNNK